MTILILDCETTSANPKKARLVQLAAYHMANGPDFTFIEQINEIIYPLGFDIPTQAAAIHGISTAEARRRGSPLRAVLDRLLVLATSAASDLTDNWLVAHNLSYDFEVLTRELERCGLEPYALSELLPLCTMKAMTERCALPGRFPGKYKWPRLSEAYQHCYPEDQRSDTKLYKAHTAMGDTLTCRDIYQRGWHQGWWGNRLA